MPEMSYNVENDRIKVELPLTSQGKLRCKKRNDIQAFGESFGPKTTIITENSYLEWQIGYDTVIGNDEKSTKLKDDKFIFTGANKKLKHPYELSEIAYYMCKIGLISKKDINMVYKAIDGIKTFLNNKYAIETKKEAPVTLNNIKFLSSSTKLPTFITRSKESELLIEIMIQKQQYATGVQPMLYLDVPVAAFSNSDDIIDNTSAKTPTGILYFDSKQKDLILNTLICFGMCSSAHNHDIKEIISLIIKYAFN